MDSSTVIANSSARLLIIFLTFFHLRVYGSEDLLQFLLGYIAANETFYAICDPAANILAGISEEIVINACYAFNRHLIAAFFIVVSGFTIPGSNRIIQSQFSFATFKKSLDRDDPKKY